MAIARLKHEIKNENRVNNNVCKRSKVSKGGIGRDREGYRDLRKTGKHRPNPVLATYGALDSNKINGHNVSYKKLF